MSEGVPPREPAIRSRTEGAAARITLNRPSRLNAFSGSMREQLASAIEAASADPAVRVIAIGGAGRAFCAGADVDAMTEMLDSGDEQGFLRNVHAGIRVVRAIAAAPQPVVAIINGVAAGAGASLAIACDLRIAAASAQIGFTFNRIALHPDWGATHFLPRLVGSGRAAELIMSARLLRAAEAGALGILDEVVTDEDLPAIAEARIDELARKPPLALATAKSSLADSDGLEAAMQREAEAQLLCFRSDDVREGIAAFREKRSPDFRGR